MTTPASDPITGASFNQAPDQYLTLKALAVYSGLCVRKLRALISDSSHPLPHYAIHRKYLVRRSEYDAWASGYRRLGNIDVDRIVSEVLDSVLNKTLD